MQSNLPNHIIGSLVGVAVGDAIGMPWEMFTHQKILELTDHHGVDDVTAPIFRKIKDSERLRRGSTTDDWQLTEAILDSILDINGYNRLDIIIKHVAAFEHSVAGWGGTTRVALGNIKDYFDSRGVKGYSPDAPQLQIPGRGLGNGIAMKVAPLPLFYGGYDYIYKTDNKIALRKSVKEVGSLTHSDVRAVAAGYAVAYIIYRVITQKSNFSYSEQFKINFLREIIHEVELFERSNPSPHWDKVSLRLKHLIKIDFLNLDYLSLIDEVGVGCIALESVIFAIAVFLRNSSDFETGIIEAVNAGGDTDTTAAIVGSMLGALLTVNAIPTKWISKVPDCQRANTKGHLLSSMIEMKKELHL